MPGSVCELTSCLKLLWYVLYLVQSPREAGCFLYPFTKGTELSFLLVPFLFPDFQLLGLPCGIFFQSGFVY